MTTNNKDKINEIFGDLLKTKDKSWTVVYTKPQREKKLAEYAKRNNIHYYLPLKESIRRYKNRKVTFYKPIFAGYIFVQITKNEKSTLLRSGHIVSFLPVKNEDDLLFSLNNLRLGIKDNPEIESYDYYIEGDKVKVKSGAMKGLIGIIESSQPGRLIIKLDFLKQAVSININPSDIELL